MTSVQVPPPAASETLAGRAFDGLAPDYDERFTRGLLGRLLRDRVWARLDARFPRPGRILDVGCGTGEDAVYLGTRGQHVVALDASQAMVDAARRKAAAARLEQRISIRLATIESLADRAARTTADDGDDALFDGAFSNFGAINCCAVDWTDLAGRLATQLKPCAPLILVVMGRTVPWEWAWYLTRAEPHRAFRRLRAGGAVWRGAVVRYPTIGELRRAFTPWFRYRCVSGLGFLLPPSYVNGWATRHPRLLHALDEWERRLWRVRALAWLADHYILELDRR